MNYAQLISTSIITSIISCIVWLRFIYKKDKQTDATINSLNIQLERANNEVTRLQDVIDTTPTFIDELKSIQRVVRLRNYRKGHKETDYVMLFIYPNSVKCSWSMTSFPPEQASGKFIDEVRELVDVEVRASTMFKAGLDAALEDSEQKAPTNP